MYGSKEYALAVALLQFSSAFENLVKASRRLPDFELGELYPFYLLDFEEIQPAAKQWCLHHAGYILASVPDRVPNPACANCKHIFAGLNEDGLCKGQKEVHCTNHPEVMFTRETVLPYLKACDVDITGCDDAALQLLYVRKVEENVHSKTHDS